MDRAARIERYKAIEEYRARPLVVYATSTRHGVKAQMAGDAVREFIDQIDEIEDEAPSVDVLIHSTGGDALTAWKLMSILRERFDEVAVLVPSMAFSAATLFSLGADEIVMHPHGSLGPIDPQITIPLPDGQKRRFSFEDVGAFLRFLQEEVRISEQAFLTPVMDQLFSVVDPVHVGGAKRASELSSEVGERLLQMHMTGMEEKASARKIAEDLNKSFFAHGDAVSRTRARELQLQVAEDDPELEGLMWEAFLGIEGYMELRKQFNPLHVFLQDPDGRETVRAREPVQLPPNTPPQAVQQVWNQVLQNAVNATTQPGHEVEFEVVNALIESARLGSEFRTRGTISAARVGGGEIRLTVTDHETGWKRMNAAAADDENGEGEGAND